DHAGARLHDAHPKGSRLRRFGLPRLHELGEEAVAARRGLGEHFIAAIAVVAAGGGRHQDARTLDWRKPLEAVDQGARRSNPAVAQEPLARLGPASTADVRPGEVNDPVE